MEKDYLQNDIVKKLQSQEDFMWVNPKLDKFANVKEKLPVSMKDIEEASERLKRFAPFIMKVFPETVASKGVIESPILKASKMQEELEKEYNFKMSGNLFVKLDSELAVAGSIKARGGIYEVLKHAEDLAIKEGLLNIEDDYSIMATDRFRKFFSNYTIQVGSTGNLGLSIGIASATIGFKVIVHMSSDARQWKKDLLRSKGATVIEYADDYSKAVSEGRKESDANPKSYFIDDENSVTLFLGYAVAALRLKEQFKDELIEVDEDNPLFVYIPCGVGGAPGGITFGLKEVFGDNVHVFFVEPTGAPCMVLGMATGLHNKISVKDIGISGETEADGLAVGRPSGFVGKTIEPMLSGEFIMKDKRLFDYMRLLIGSEETFIEPSAAACFEGPVRLEEYKEGGGYIKAHNLEEKMKNVTHLSWATGGRLVPEEERKVYIETFL
ncbi:MAG: D-serine ammonia-lyase [Lachnospiraceae bacterium]|jgi:D-serine dehydratase|nr:D-serine ammonia-lyase [Lachnospiraceae bacterium]